MWEDWAVYLLLACVVGFIIYVNIDYHRFMKPLTKEEREDYLKGLHDPGDW